MATATQSYIIKKNSGGNFTPMSEGLHQAVVAEVKDLGVITGAFGAQHKFVVRFVNAEGAEASRFYTPSIHEKSTLFKDFSPIVPFGDEFDIYSLVGQQVQVFVTSGVNSKGQANAKVEKVLKPVKGQKVPYTKKDAAPAKSPAKASAAPPKDVLAGTEITDDDLPDFAR